MRRAARRCTPPDRSCRRQHGEQNQTRPRGTGGSSSGTDRDTDRATTGAQRWDPVDPSRPRSSATGTCSLCK